MSIIELINEFETKCTSCGGMANVKSMLLKDTKPHRTLHHLGCPNCGYTETHEEDLETLDYGVEITCDFTDQNNLHSNIRRMMFINHHSKVVFYEGEKELFDCSSATSSVDCVEGLVMNLTESFSNSASDSNGCLANLVEKLNSFRENTGFKMVITDNTGYSRVCPEGVEYTEIQDVTIEELNKINPNVIHRKISKQ